MESVTGLIISKNDYEKLSALLSSARSETADLLQLELDRAQVIETEGVLPDVICMNSTVEYVDLETQKKHHVTLVYPEFANIEEKKISVLAPIGAALIGLRVGQTITWPLPNGVEKKIQVVSVTTQLDSN